MADDKVRQLAERLEDVHALGCECLCINTISKMAHLLRAELKPLLGLFDQVADAARCNDEDCAICKKMDELAAELKHWRKE